VLVEGRAHLGRAHEVVARQAGGLVVFPQRVGLDLVARGAGQRQRRRHRGRHQRAAPQQPGLPQRLRVEAQRGRLDEGAAAFQPAQRLLAHRQHAVFHRQVAAQVGQPAHAQAAHAGVGRRHE
jgi:hypothetical protein